MIRLLLDENISSALVRLLAGLDVYSQSVPAAQLTAFFKARTASLCIPFSQQTRPRSS